MGPLAQFLLALSNLVRSGIIRNIPTALKAAEREFGKVTPLLKKQIERIFEQAKKPVVGKPGKKEGTVLPFVKKTDAVLLAEDLAESKGIDYDNLPVRERTKIYGRALDGLQKFRMKKEVAKTD